jgi:ABC-type sugar transport system substrate-binding protein
MIRAVRGVAAATALALGLTGGSAAAQKAGGTLRVYGADSPPGLNIYEQATRFAAIRQARLLPAHSAIQSCKPAAMPWSPHGRGLRPSSPAHR